MASINPIAEQPVKIFEPVEDQRIFSLYFYNQELEGAVQKNISRCFAWPPVQSKIINLSRYYEPSEDRNNYYSAQIVNKLGSLAISSNSSIALRAEQLNRLTEFLDRLIKHIAQKLNTDNLIAYYLLKTDQTQRFVLNLLFSNIFGRFELNVQSIEKMKGGFSQGVNEDDDDIRQIMGYVRKTYQDQRCRLFRIVLELFLNRRSTKTQEAKRYYLRKGIVKRLFGNYLKLEKEAELSTGERDIRSICQQEALATLDVLACILHHFGSAYNPDFHRTRLYNQTLAEGVNINQIIDAFESRLSKSNIGPTLVKIIQEVLMALLPIKQTICLYKRINSSAAEKDEIQALWKKVFNGLAKTKSLALLPFRQLVALVSKLYNISAPQSLKLAERENQFQDLYFCLKKTLDVWPIWLQFYLIPQPSSQISQGDSSRQQLTALKAKAEFVIRLLNDFTKTQAGKIRFSSLAWSALPKKDNQDVNAEDEQEDENFSNIRDFAFSLSELGNFSYTLQILALLLPEDNPYCIVNMFDFIKFKEKTMRDKMKISLRRYLMAPLKLGIVGYSENRFSPPENMNTHVRFICRCIKSYPTALEILEAFMFPEEPEELKSNRSPSHVNDDVAVVSMKGVNLIMALLNYLFFSQFSDPLTSSYVFDSLDVLLQSRYRQLSLFGLHITFFMVHRRQNPWLNNMFQIFFAKQSNYDFGEKALQKSILRHLKTILSSDWAYTSLSYYCDPEQETSQNIKTLRKIRNAERCSSYELSSLVNKRSKFECSLVWVQLLLNILQATPCPETLELLALIIQKYLSFSSKLTQLDSLVRQFVSQIRVQIVQQIEAFILNSLRAGQYDRSFNKTNLFDFTNELLDSIKNETLEEKYLQAESAIINSLLVYESVLQLLLMGQNPETSNMFRSTLLSSPFYLIQLIASRIEPTNMFHFDGSQPTNRVNIVMSIATLIKVEEHIARKKLYERKLLEQQELLNELSELAPLEDKKILKLVYRVERQLLGSRLKKPMFKSYQSKTNIRICATRVLTLLTQYLSAASHDSPYTISRINTNTLRTPKGPGRSVSIVNCLSKPNLVSAINSTTSLQQYATLQDFLYELLNMLVNEGTDKPISRKSHIKLETGAFLDLLNTLIEREPVVLQYLFDRDRKKETISPSFLSESRNLQNLFQRLILGFSSQFSQQAEYLNNPRYFYDRPNAFWLYQKYIQLIHLTIISEYPKQAMRSLSLTLQFLPLKLLDFLLKIQKSVKLNYRKPLFDINIIAVKEQCQAILSLIDEIQVYEESIRLWCVEAVIDMLVSCLLSEETTMTDSMSQAYYMLIQPQFVAKIFLLSTDSRCIPLRFDILQRRNTQAQEINLQICQKRNKTGKQFIDTNIYGYGRSFGYDSLELYSMCPEEDVESLNKACMHLTYQNIQQNLLLTWVEFFSTFTNIGKEGYAFSRMHLPKLMAENYFALEKLQTILGANFRMVNSRQLKVGFSVYRPLSNPLDPDYREAINKWETLLRQIISLTQRTKNASQKKTDVQVIYGLFSLKVLALQTALTVAVECLDENRLADIFTKVVFDVLDTQEKQIIASEAGILLLCSCVLAYQRSNQRNELVNRAKTQLVTTTLKEYLYFPRECLPFLKIINYSNTQELDALKKCLEMTIHKVNQGQFQDIMCVCHLVIAICAAEEASLIELSVLEFQKLRIIWNKIEELTQPEQKNLAQRGFLILLQALVCSESNTQRTILVVQVLRMIETPVATTALQLKMHYPGMTTLKNLEESEKIIYTIISCFDAKYEKIGAWLSSFEETIVNDSIFSNCSLITGFSASDQEKNLKNIYYDQKGPANLANMSTMSFFNRTGHASYSEQYQRTSLFDFMCKVQLICTLNAYLLLCRSCIEGNNCKDLDVLRRHLANLQYIIVWLRGFKTSMRNREELLGLIKLRNQINVVSSETANTRFYSSEWTTQYYLDEYSFGVMMASCWANLLVFWKQLMMIISSGYTYSEDQKQLQVRLREREIQFLNEFSAYTSAESVLVHGQFLKRVS